MGDGAGTDLQPALEPLRGALVGGKGMKVGSGGPAEDLGVIEDLGDERRVLGEKGRSVSRGPVRRTGSGDFTRCSCRAKLLESDFLPGPIVAWVTALLGAPQVRLTEGVLPVLRTGMPAVPSREGDTREVIGAGARMADASFLEASRQWWRCHADAIVSAGVLAVAMEGGG
ncbi:hypothetical protein ACIOGT_29370 [Streptomyces microflavus]|uniref:hypothetical protein n=1 Tax=Streptomyces microflavus TaxID=1919 RepID=UPI00381FBDE7